MQNEITTKDWKKNVKQILTKKELTEKIKENRNMYPFNILSTISAISGFISLYNINPKYKTFTIIISSGMALLSTASGITIINNKKIIKKYKLERKKKYKQIIKDTKKLKNVEEKENVLIKKYKLQTNIQKND